MADGPRASHPRFRRCRTLGSVTTADTDLLAAASTGDADAVRAALDAGAHTEARDDHDRTPLLLASAADHVEVARVLVAAGADPEPSTTATTPRGSSLV